MIKYFKFKAYYLPLLCFLYNRGRVKYIDLILYYKSVKFSFWFSI